MNALRISVRLPADLGTPTSVAKLTVRAVNDNDNNGGGINRSIAQLRRELAAAGQLDSQQQNDVAAIDPYSRAVIQETTSSSTWSRSGSLKTS